MSEKDREDNYACKTALAKTYKNDRLSFIKRDHATDVEWNPSGRQGIATSKELLNQLYKELALRSPNLVNE
jgi:hypothetical protein